MKSILARKCVRREPVDAVTWAQAFVASPACTARDVRDRAIVADLLMQVGVAR